MKEKKYFTSVEKVNTYEITLPLLESMYVEFKEISKKKPDSTISKSKIAIVNRLLNKIRFVLNDQESIDFLDLLIEDDMPQASDVTLMLSQYLAAMRTYKEKYYGWDGSDHTWFIDDNKKR